MRYDEISELAYLALGQRGLGASFVLVVRRAQRSQSRLTRLTDLLELSYMLPRVLKVDLGNLQRRAKSETTMSKSWTAIWNKKGRIEKNIPKLSHLSLKLLLLRHPVICLHTIHSHRRRRRDRPSALIDRQLLLVPLELTGEIRDLLFEVGLTRFCTCEGFAGGGEFLSL